MAGALVGALRVTLGIDTAAFEEGLGIAQKRLNAAGRKMKEVGDSMANVGTTLSVAVTAPILAAGAAAVQGAQAQAQAMAQVNAALESMGPVAGRTADQLLKASDALELNSLFDGDEILQKVTANMLTFGNVSGQAFDRAQQAALDLSTRLGTDLQSSTIMIGKALNDPVKGITALSRVGIQLTEDQKALIRSMSETGNVAGAQSIILGELERQFGGAAKAAADTSPWRRAQVAIGQAGDAVGEMLLPVIAKVSGFVERVALAFANLSPGMQSFIVTAAGIAAVVGPLLVVFGTLVSSIGSLIPVFAPVLALISGAFGAGGVFAGAFSSLSSFTAMLSLIGPVVAPLLAPLAAVAAAGALIYANWDKISPVLSELRDKFVAALGPKLTSLIETVKTTISSMVSTLTPVLTALWQGPLGQMITAVIDGLGMLAAAFIAVLGEELIRIISAAVAAIEAGFKIVGDVFQIVIGLLSGDFAMAWEGLKSLVRNVIDGVVNILRSLAPEAVKVIGDLASAFAQRLGQLASDMITLGRNIIDGLVRGIQAAPEAVWNALKSVVLRGVENIREFLGIASPSRLFMAMGGFITSGLAIGITGGLPEVETAMAALSDTVAGELNSLPTGQGITLDPTADQQQENALTDGFRRTFSDGIQAAMNGDLGSFLDRTFSNIADNAFRSVIDGLANVLLGGGRGGGGGLLATFAGFFAKGGTIPNGGWGIVGERGPEPVFATASGIGVLPNSSLRQMTGGQGGGMMVSTTINIDATGADPATVARLNTKLDQLRTDLPGQIVRTVQDASNRRILNVSAR